MAEMRTLSINGTLYDDIVDENARAGVENLKNNAKPLLLEEAAASAYDVDSTFGDIALQAILDGRQILVRVPNADGRSFTAIYSPVYMYQLPNVDCDYLYLFYLKDVKQDIDLTSIGAGIIKMPVYGELKMKLSQTYTKCPLME